VKLLLEPLTVSALIADPAMSVNLADPGAIALVVHLAAAAQQLGTKVRE
jgi:hypothetical protein